MLATLTRRLKTSKATLLGSAVASVASLSFGAAHLSSATAHSAKPLNPNDWVGLKLLSSEQLTSGDRPTHLLRFELSPEQPPMPVASCILTRLPVGSEKEDGTRAFVMRPYTAVSAADDKTLDLALKVYPDGKLTPSLVALKPGAILDFKGPIPKIPIEECSRKKSIGMVAGGTGITPMLQIASELLRTGYKGDIRLIYANVSPKDIMLKDRVNALAVKHSNFKVHYLVDKAEKGWTGGVGYVTAEVLKSQMPAPSDENSLILVCGPPPMMKAVSGDKVSPKDQGQLSGLLKGLGYSESNVYKF